MSLRRRKTVRLARLLSELDARAGAHRTRPAGRRVARVSLARA